MNCMLFQNNYIKVWNEIKMGKVALIVARISMVKMNVLLRMMLLFRTISVLKNHALFKQWQNDLSKFL